MNALLTLAAGIMGWRIAARLKLPAPAMLGSMIAVGLTNILFDYAALPLAVKVFAQAISGAFIGLQINRSDLGRLKSLIVPFLILAVLLTANTFVVGIVIRQLCGWDWMTALLACVAGGVTDISLIAMEMGADVGTVAMMQTSRLVGVLLFFPYWIQFLTRHEPDAEKLAVTEIPQPMRITLLDRLICRRGGKIAFTLLLSLGLGMIGNASGLPAASMVFPMISVVGFNCTTSVCAVPVQIKNLAQLLAGSLVGVSITAATFGSLSSTLVPVGILLVSYWVVNLIYSLLCKHRHLLDLKSAMFASAPGGATDMSLIAADLGADLSQIALIQVLRAAYVVAVMPPLILGFIRLWG